MRIVSAFAAVALAFCVAACESKPVTGTISESLITSTATVEELDLATRHLTLRDANGKSISMTAPEEVRNLPQVKVGDEVVVSYYESVAYEVKKPGEATPGVVATQTAGRAKAGEMPGVGTASIATVTVTIESMDKSIPTVTLRGADGRLTVVKVKDREKLDRVSVGDLVEITYTEALAVKVEKR